MQYSLIFSCETFQLFGKCSYCIYQNNDHAALTHHTCTGTLTVNTCRQCNAAQAYDNRYPLDHCFSSSSKLHIDKHKCTCVQETVLAANILSLLRINKDLFISENFSYAMLLMLLYVFLWSILRTLFHSIT